LRKQLGAFAGGELEIIPTENDHVLGFMRIHAGNRAIIFANFSESPQTIPARIVEQYSIQNKKKLYGDSSISSQGDINIEPVVFLIFA